MLAADGFERVELVVPLRALQLAGADVDVVSFRRGRIRGVNLHMPAARIGVDKTISAADPDRYDGLLLPGGFINPDLLRQSGQARRFVAAFADSDKPIVTLCHGPWVLASAGLLGGRTLTCWPGIRDDVVNAGAVWLDREVVRDGNLVTSRGPQDMAAFVPAMLDAFERPPSQTHGAGPPQVSDPQLSEPIGWAVAMLRWAPKPSLPAAIVGLAVGARLYQGLSRRRALP
ncbi:type 1 glutamine amidotransferase domain-containing protein [Mycobacterium sp. 1274756.6]|uniref:type 1 glutamine amidotransferase domain-containing protein n=1 Tax=Mycobacterium sp. 1274756.6 TaxID=1834076 RepID=UPI001E408C49|nr:type 1 glutamine amidotransferase domain-containing protein [Mycobacterium sp. 1274756.6]